VTGSKKVKAEEGALREVKVTFAEGNTINTNMAKGITDDEIRDYYAIGKQFNVGAGENDNMQAVTKVEILAKRKVKAGPGLVVGDRVQSTTDNESGVVKDIHDSGDMKVLVKWDGGGEEWVLAAWVTKVAGSRKVKASTDESPDSEDIDGCDVRVYDNGGETFDRYTIVIENPVTNEQSWLGSSEDPFFPTGFGQHLGSNLDGLQEGEHLGKLIKFAELPEPVQKFVKQDTEVMAPTPEELASLNGSKKKTEIKAGKYTGDIDADFEATLVDVLAETVAGSSLPLISKDNPAEDAAKVQALAKHLADRARQIYKNNPKWGQKMARAEASEAGARDQLAMWMEHWAAAWKNNGGMSTEDARIDKFGSPAEMQPSSRRLKAAESEVEEDGPFIEETVSVKLTWEEAATLAKRFGYDLEPSFDPGAYDAGYTASDAKNLRIPKKYDGAADLFPEEVAMAAGDAEAAAAEVEVAKASKDAFTEALESINVVGEYVDMMNNIQVQRLKNTPEVVSATWDGEGYDAGLDIVIQNPTHLFNDIINGVGLFAPDLEVNEPMSPEDVKGYLGYLNDYFEVYGDRKPEISDRIEPDVSDEDLEYHLEYRLRESGDITLDRAGEAIIEHMGEEYERPAPEDEAEKESWMDEIKEWAVKVAAWTGLEADAIIKAAEAKMLSGNLAPPKT